MITRPLDLSSRLRPPSRSMDVWFVANVGVIALFFSVFGSRFVLSPGLATDFALPVAQAGQLTAVPTDVVIAVKGTDMALAEGAVLDFAALENWLVERVGERPGLSLLVQAGAAVTTGDLAQIHAMAARAGFARVLVAAERGRDEVTR